MEVFGFLVILAIVVSYLNLYLIIKKEKPTIIINNNFPNKEFRSENVSAVEESKYADYSHSGTTEIPIESHVTIKDLKGEINLDSERIGNSDVNSLTDKVKQFRSK